MEMRKPIACVAVSKLVDLLGIMLMRLSNERRYSLSAKQAMIMILFFNFSRLFQMKCSISLI